MPIPFVWRGKKYHSVAAASRAAGVSDRVLARAAMRGTADRAGMGDSGPRAAIPVTWRGRQYRSLNALASELRRHTKTIRRHHDAGTLDSLEVRRA